MKNIVAHIFFFPVILFAQNVEPNIQKDNMLWLRYYNTIAINPKWSINSDAQLRTKNWYQHFSQTVLRVGISYNINDKLTVTMGGAHFRYFIIDGVTRGEWRPWQEFAVHDRLSSIKLSHRFRLEERFNQLVKANEPTNDYVFNYRLRYKIDLLFPITKNGSGKTLILLLGNELMVNAGKAITYNYFDQNRSYLGLNLELNKKLALQLQYMHIWQQLSSGDTFLSTEVIRFNFYHTIAL